jgi:hypothetical protein
MILTASDIDSLARSLSRWDWGEYISEAFVIIACAGELVADLEVSWLTKERKKHLQRRSTILLVAALSVSMICLVRTNELSGSVIGSLGDKAGAAETKAQSALEAVGKAQDKADAVEKKADDLLKKYDAAERELIALKAKSLPRRLSSEQIELLRKRVATFSAKSISLACENGGKEALDFELDFVKAFDPIRKLKVYLVSCSIVVGGVVSQPPIQIEAGSERQGDADILVKALADIGINKSDIVRKPNNDRTLLELTIGPKAP